MIIKNKYTCKSIWKSQIFTNFGNLLHSLKSEYKNRPYLEKQVFSKRKKKKISCVLGIWQVFLTVLLKRKTCYGAIRIPCVYCNINSEREFFL